VWCVGGGREVKVLSGCRRSGLGLGVWFRQRTPNISFRRYSDCLDKTNQQQLLMVGALSIAASHWISTINGLPSCNDVDDVESTNYWNYREITSSAENARVENAVCRYLCYSVSFRSVVNRFLRVCVICFWINHVSFAWIALYTYYSLAFLVHKNSVSRFRANSLLNIESTPRQW